MQTQSRSYTHCAIARKGHVDCLICLSSKGHDWKDEETYFKTVYNKVLRHQGSSCLYYYNNIVACSVEQTIFRPI